MITRCAWCLKEMNLKPEPGSHGICARHKQTVLDELKERNIAERVTRYNAMVLGLVMDAVEMPRRDA